MKTRAAMFHHFHNNKTYPPVQGSISADEFNHIISYLEQNYTLLNAKEYKQKCIDRTIEPNETCITFDDTLRCQYEIARPVLEEKKLTAFWFIYSSVLDGNIEYLELFRDFRTNFYEDIDNFYIDFFYQTEKHSKEYKLNYKYQINQFEKSNYLKRFEFYSDNDRKFRYIRDVIFTPEQFNRINLTMMHEKGYNIIDQKDRLWMTANQIKKLAEDDHEIGLHSYSHPTDIKKLTYQEQWQEYEKNKNRLEQITGRKVETMSHPCGSFNNDTLKVLSELGINVGFNSIIDDDNKHVLTLSRIDHAILLRYAMKAY